VFGRDVFGLSKVELCRECIGDLELDWPVGAPDRPEPPRPDPTAPGITWGTVAVVIGFAVLAVVVGLAASSVARTLAARLAGD
jgi:hypothetical protein